MYVLACSRVARCATLQQSRLISILHHRGMSMSPLMARHTPGSESMLSKKSPAIISPLLARHYYEFKPRGGAAATQCPTPTVRVVPAQRLQSSTVVVKSGSAAAHAEDDPNAKYYKDGKRRTYWTREMKFSGAWILLYGCFWVFIHNWSPADPMDDYKLKDAMMLGFVILLLLIPLEGAWAPAAGLAAAASS